MQNTLTIEEKKQSAGKNLIQSRIEEISRLHSEIKTLFLNSLEKAIRIGALLEEQKKSLSHGEFTPWVIKNLPFGERTARNYRVVYKKREILNRQVVSDLNSAYMLLTQQRNEQKEREQEKRLEAEKKRYEYALHHPEEVEIDKAEYAKSKAGYKVRRKTVGELRGLPLVKEECFDPEYLELKKNRLLFADDMELAISDIKAVIYCLESIQKKYPDKIKTAYSFSIDEGKKCLYPELIKVWQKLDQIMQKVDQSKGSCSESNRSQPSQWIEGMRPGWTRWPG
ncbi:MAG: DUF3102 domain-containing protein [Clostridia bacterium]|jgi:hypothetical protein|nr:DUF3102 domain-containing protein [Clostridia bacterium]